MDSVGTWPLDQQKTIREDMSTRLYHTESAYKITTWEITQIICFDTLLSWLSLYIKYVANITVTDISNTNTLNIYTWSCEIQKTTVINYELTKTIK